MAIATLEALQSDRIVMSVARALAVANEAAIAHGTEPAQSLISITEESSPAGPVWRIDYIKRDYVNRRGGDLIVLVDGVSQTVQRVLRGVQPAVRQDVERLRRADPTGAARLSADAGGLLWSDRPDLLPVFPDAVGLHSAT